MAKPEDPVASDFAEVMLLLQRRGMVDATPSRDLINISKGIHASTYSMILWRFRLQDLPLHGQVFLDEVSSDALQLLPQVVMGFGKTTSLLIRGILENSLRHIYFADHPVEFVRLNRDRKWYLSMEFLLDYAKNHFDFQETESKFDALSQISSLYAEMSEILHGRTVRNLEQHCALAEIEFELTNAKKFAGAVKRCTQAVNFLLAIFHRDSLRQFATADRRLILRSVPPNARQVWMDHS